MSTPALIPLPAVVIGGGISGLACAYRLQQAGISTLVLEAGIRPGGVISTIEQDGFHFELGPQSFLSTEPLSKLIDALGLKDELLNADSRAPRYILLGGKLVCAPLSPPALLTTSLFGPTTKWRVYSELAQQTKPPDTDESIAAFVRRKFGDELLDRLVGPFVSGIYAGDPEKLSMRAAFPKVHEMEAKYGSVLRGAMKSRPPKGTPRAGLCSFRNGMGTLPGALGKRLAGSLRLETSFTGLRRGKMNEKSWFELEVTHDGHPETLMASAVICAAPAYTAPDLLKEISEQFVATFARIEHAPVAVVAAGYRLDQFREPPNGFGFLVPRSERLHVLGTVWNSSLFPGRAPDGMAAFTSFAGGATDPEFCQLSENEIGDTICREVGNVLGITGPPVTRMVHRYARALPQYNLGHTEIVSELGKIASAVPGLFLTGNYLSGPSIGSCVEQANQTANAARVYLASIGVTGVGAVAHA